MAKDSTGIATALEIKDKKAWPNTISYHNDKCPPYRDIINNLLLGWKINGIYQEDQCVKYIDIIEASWMKVRLYGVGNPNVWPNSIGVHFALFAPTAETSIEGGTATVQYGIETYYPLDRPDYTDVYVGVKTELMNSYTKTSSTVSLYEGCTLHILITMADSYTIGEMNVMVV